MIVADQQLQSDNTEFWGNIRKYIQDIESVLKEQAIHENTTKHKQ
jgi:hypothetical protein